MNRVNQRVTELLAYDPEELLRNVNIPKALEEKLYDYQIFQVLNLVTSLRRHKIAIDGSDTGTGKTYTAIAACKQLNISPMIIAPKSVLAVWESVCKLLGVNAVLIVNYESASKYTDKYTPDIVIFDEAHRCKNPTTHNGKLLMSFKDKCYILLLSATIADTPEAFCIFGYMLKFYKTLKQGKAWVTHMTKEDRMSIQQGSSLSKVLYPEYGSRMRVEDLGNKFPQNQVTVECYTIDKKYVAEVNSSLECIAEYSGEILAKINAARQRLEEIKTPIIIDLIHTHLDAGQNVAVFVNFTKTLNTIAREFNTKSVIHGGQTDRQQIIDDFQDNKTNLIICNVQSGGTGISLHDLYGRQRVSIISLSDSSIDFEQVLGRIYRAGSKTPALQRIVCCAGTYEENICANIRNKLKFTESIKENS